MVFLDLFMVLTAFATQELHWFISRIVFLFQKSNSLKYSISPAKLLKTINLLSVSVNFPILDISCPCNHTLFTFYLWLISFHIRFSEFLFMADWCSVVTDRCKYCCREHCTCLHTCLSSHLYLFGVYTLEIRLLVRPHSVFDFLSYVKFLVMRENPSSLSAWYRGYHLHVPSHRREDVVHCRPYWHLLVITYVKRLWFGWVLFPFVLLPSDIK